MSVVAGVFVWSDNVSRQDWVKFKQKEPTSSSTIQVDCYADKRMFLPDFNDMPKDMQNIFKGSGSISIPCEGSGYAGIWCEKCVFGKVVEID